MDPKKLYSEHCFGDFGDKTPGHQHLVHFLQSVPDKHNVILIDVGCGAGYWMKFAERIGFAKELIIGIDQSSSGTEALSSEGYSVIAGDIEHIKCNDNIADVVMSNGVIHHTKNSKKAFSEICRITKPGGLIMISVYNIWNPYFWIVHRATYPLRWIYWNLSRKILPFLSFLLWPLANAGALFSHGIWIKDFSKVQVLVADQVLTPYAELFTKNKLLELGILNDLENIHDGFVKRMFMRYAVFRKK